jgi:hypothetical protein
MNKQFLINNFGWGFILWFIGYALSFILFFLVPPSYIGWILMPLGILATIWVLLKKIKVKQSGQYLFIGIIWVLMAIVLDYIFIVKALNPADGYYKPSVYIYYILTLLLPIVIGFFKRSK